MLYAAGSTGPGTGATALLASPALSNLDGSFTATGFACPTDQSQIYAVARGGNPGLPAGTNNTALVLLTALGDCSTLTDTSTITFNERTTVAAAWSLAHFAATGVTSSLTIGASSTNTTGLRNAFLTVGDLVDTATGTQTGPTLPPSAVAPTDRLNTLANALAVCASSTGGAACSALFDAATIAGSAPTNTFEAALAIVRKPASQVASVFAAASATGPLSALAQSSSRGLDPADHLRCLRDLRRTQRPHRSSHRLHRSSMGRKLLRQRSLKVLTNRPARQHERLRRRYRRIVRPHHRPIRQHLDRQPGDQRRGQQRLRQRQ